MARKFTGLYKEKTGASSGGRVLKKLCTDELRGTWVFNDTLSFFSPNTGEWGVRFSFYCYVQDPWSTGIMVDSTNGWLVYRSTIDGALHSNVVYMDGRWLYDDRKTIHIVSRLDEVYGGYGLLEWLQSNATKIV